VLAGPANDGNIQEKKQSAANCIQSSLKAHQRKADFATSLTPHLSVWISPHSLSSYDAVGFVEPIIIHICLLLVVRYSTLTLLDQETS
jgi:hypothetical protein